MAGRVPASRPDGGTVAFFNTARGLYDQPNQLGFTNWFALDAAARRRAETKANGGVTQFSYDPAARFAFWLDKKRAAFYFVAKPVAMSS